MQQHHNQNKDAALLYGSDGPDCYKGKLQYDEGKEQEGLELQPFLEHNYQVYLSPVVLLQVVGVEQLVMNDAVEGEPLLHMAVNVGDEALRGLQLFFPEEDIFRPPVFVLEVVFNQQPQTLLLYI